jgi:hypothetical protein
MELKVVNTKIKITPTGYQMSDRRIHLIGSKRSLRISDIRKALELINLNKGRDLQKITTQDCLLSLYSYLLYAEKWNMLFLKDKRDYFDIDSFSSRHEAHFADPVLRNKRGVVYKYFTFVSAIVELEMKRSNITDPIQLYLYHQRWGCELNKSEFLKFAMTTPVK